MLRRRLDLHAFNEWVTRNRLVLWWVILTPLFVIAFILSYPQLKVETSQIETVQGLWIAILNTPPLLFLFRLVALAFGLVMLLIGFFLPTLRVGTQGVSWAHEIEERLVDMAGEFAGDEVEQVVSYEKARWEAILYWQRLNPAGVEVSSLVYNLLSTLQAHFFDDQMVMQLTAEKKTIALTHPLSDFLVPELRDEGEPGQRIGAELHLPKEEWLLVLETEQKEGYSALDQDFLWVIIDLFERVLERTEILGLLPHLSDFSRIESNIGPGEGI